MSKHAHTALLPGVGTDQQQRWLEALNPEGLKLHGFDVADWMKFAWNFAEKVNYFNSANEQEGNWQDFFVEETEIKQFLNELDNGTDLSPQLTLFVCFLKLLDISKEHFNHITQRHLDFYYQEILKIDKQEAIPDQVHILFELAKNISQERIAPNIALDAGKDKLGNKLIYTTQDELIASRASIVKIKNIYHHSSSNQHAIKACEVANSFDGNGKPNPSGDLKWFPFGYVLPTYADDQPELPDAKLGFALSSDVLYLKEGKRTISVVFKFTEAIPEQLGNYAEQSIRVFLSGDKKWLGPFSCKASTSGNDLLLETVLEPNVEPLTGYNPNLLGEKFSTVSPVIRFIVDQQSEQGYQVIDKLDKIKIQKIELIVSVDGLTSVVLENDMGVINGQKPFLPFGPVPVKNSKLTIKSDEIFRKNWKQITLDFNWMNTPASFVNQYFAYRNNLSLPTAQLFKSGIKRKAHQLLDYDTDNLIVANDSYFTASVGLYQNSQWVTASNNQILFTPQNSAYRCSIGVTNPSTGLDENGKIQIALNQSFLHEMFPRIYAMAMQNDANTLIPKDPYTPMIESVSIGYSASAEISFNVIKSGDNSVNLYHEHPFGQALISDDPAITLLPSYPPGGELYLGVKDVEPLQQLSMLFQVFEGSENPESVGFSPGEKIEWSILCANKWKPLTSNYLISNQTDNLLKSGIVKISIPAEASADNTMLESGLHWIRLRMDKNYDVVCKLIDIKTQAVVAQFNNQNKNELFYSSRLQANTIGKLAERRQSIKSVNQPFSSFGGTPVETNQAYYQRISERLRHKNRAITLWDYERLILQQFPEIHKVRCLNHTSATSYLAPGNVMLVVIPDIQNKNVFDIYQPRLSRAKLNEVQTFINQLNSQHVNTMVINPEYEEVQLVLKVKFRSGYDENYYRKVLQDDLTKILSPWAFERTVDLQFGTTLHQSIIIQTIEKLNYVDFFTELKIKHTNEFKTSVAPSGPKSIIVSAKVHDITVLQTGCTK